MLYKKYEKFPDSAIPLDIPNLENLLALTKLFFEWMDEVKLQFNEEDIKCFLYVLSRNIQEKYFESILNG